MYRADRLLAICPGRSRRECVELLQAGRVFQVLGEDLDKNDGSVLLQVVPGYKVKLSFKSTLRVDPQYDVPMTTIPLLAIYHKPKVSKYLHWL